MVFVQEAKKENETQNNVPLPPKFRDHDDDWLSEF
jgi:hypothetical protein